MSEVQNELCVAGVDGAAGGWMVIIRHLGTPYTHEAHLVGSFSEILTRWPQLQRIAIDMPIGLPDHIGQNGRGPEKAVRPLLGMRQSTVFSIPSRAAVYAEDYWEACKVAQATSAPPKKVSKQAFNIFPKIRELDAAMSPELESCIFEVHPEVAFWRLNGEEPIVAPKRVKGQPSGAGLDVRRDLLCNYGYSAHFLDQKASKGAARDDLIDAAVNAVIAERLLLGQAQPFPANYERDSNGLRMAIWA
ncbi:DUF429 domain-containing protein [Rhodobacteraceae bacterium RKSG542]|uniref:DUF429 domain-containing protein n=1 Tax=Pseudovibrio flavus TaxID=2529854 RepID=UPI0012BC44BB|nr:DUF429 domain-containing protein [Pseudovibrio flavus]MTI18307.1 DUF429 domain-containing protein [Pseudovibrio flavus]